MWRYCFACRLTCWFKDIGEGWFKCSNCDHKTREEWK